MGFSSAGFKHVRDIGLGNECRLYAITSPLGQELRVKCYEKRNMKALHVDEFLDDLDALRGLESGQLERLFDFFQDNDYYYVVAESPSGGDMTLLRNRARELNIAMSEKWWRDIFRQLLEGIGFLHSHVVTHCNIKEANLMLKTNDIQFPVVVVVDWGVSKATSSSPGRAPGGGTLGYTPPETWESERWGPRGDVFAAGVCMLQLLADRVPPLGPRTKLTPGGIFLEGCTSVEEVRAATISRQPPLNLLPVGVSQELHGLLLSLLEKRVQFRPLVPQVLADLWFIGNVSTEPLESPTCVGTVGVTCGALRIAPTFSNSVSCG